MKTINVLSMKDSNKFQMLDVLFGIGITKFVLNVLKDGISINKEDVLQLMTFVNLILMVFVLNAIKVMILLKDSVFLENNLKLRMLDVLSGIGTIKFVYNVQRDGILIKKEFVNKLMNIVKNTYNQVLA